MQTMKMARLGLIALCVCGTQQAWGQSAADPFKLDFMKTAAFALRAEPGFTHFGVDLGDRSDFVSTATEVTYGDLTLGATAFIANQFSIDAYVRTPLTKAKNQMSFTGGTATQSSDVNRFEYNLTGYYRLENYPAGIFVGWRGDETDVKAKTVSVGVIQDKWNFKTSGPTVGGTYGWVSDDTKSNYSVSAGLTYQTGKIDLSSSGVAGASTSGSKKAVGAVLALKYGKVLSRNLDMFLTADMYQTDFGRIAFSNGQSAPFLQYSWSGRVGARYTF